MTLGRRITAGLLGIFLVSVGSCWFLGRRVAEYNAEATVQASPEKIFMFLTDPELQVHWIGGLVRSTPTTKGALRAGSRSVEVMQKGSRTIQSNTLVVRIEEPRYLETEVQSAYWLARSIFELKEGTHLQHKMFVNYKGFWMRTLAPMMKATVQKKLQDDLSRLKTLVESKNL